MSGMERVRVPLIPYTPEVRELLTEGLFKPIDPTDFWREAHWHRNLEVEFLREFEAKIDLGGHRYLSSESSRPSSDEVRFHIHVDKVSYDVGKVLRATGLGEYDPGKTHEMHDLYPATYKSDWWQVEESTALLYMSLLAKYLADIQQNITIPGTDREEYMSLSYAPLSDYGRNEACLSVQLASCLPVPREDVPLSEIVKFKRSRHNELSHFRNCIDDLHEKLAKAEDEREIRDIVQRSKETFEREIRDLTAQLKDASLATKLGSLKTLFSVGNPALAGWLAEVMGYGEKVPIDLGLSGLAVGGSIGVAQYLVGQGNERRSKLRESSYAYLYYAGAESVL